MSYDLEVNQVLEAKLYAQSSGQYSVNTRHYRVTAIAGTGETDVNAAARIETELAPAFKACLNENANYLGLSLQIIRTIRRPKAVVTAGSGPGLIEGDALPRQVCGLITVLTDTASRNGRGRMYVPFPPESRNLATAVPNAEYLGELDSLAIKLDNVLVVGGGGNTASIQPVLYNRVTQAVIPVTGVRVAALWATQRRRSDIRGGDRPPF